MPRRHPKRRLPLLPSVGALVLLAAALLPAQPPADELSAAARSFGDAMARMMDAMGLLGDDDVAPAPAPGTMPGLGAPFGMGQMPWSAMPGAGSMPDAGAWMEQMPGMPRLPTIPGWRRTSLDGVWEGRDGALLIVQAHRFRLYSPRCEYIDGLIQQRGDRIAMYEPEHDVARPYEVAQHQGRLVLRDPAGQVYLYRRLWHDEIGYGEGAYTGGSGTER